MPRYKCKSIAALDIALAVLMFDVPPTQAPLAGLSLRARMANRTVRGFTEARLRGWACKMGYRGWPLRLADR
jgi:hypothetical protein